MIVPFLVNAVVTAATLGLAAAAAERALLVFGRPTRGPWAVALIGSVVLPVVFFVAPEVAGAPHWLMGESMAEVLFAAAAPLTASGPTDWILLAGWVALSGLAVVRVTVAAVRLRWMRRRWVPDTVAGFPVWVSERIGPAVAGGRIVVPRWVLGVDPRSQVLMLSHEQEHLTARDPALLSTALVAAALMPWNVPLWWMAHRLRLAVEVDCDARVLRRGRADTPTYASMLLEVGRRSAGLPAAVATPLARSPSQLERRLLAMTRPAARRGRLAEACGAVGLVAAALAVVWTTPHPLYGYCEIDARAAAVVSPAAPRRVAVFVGPPRALRVLPTRGAKEI